MKSPFLKSALAAAVATPGVPVTMQAAVPVQVEQRTTYSNPSYSNLSRTGATRFEIAPAGTYRALYSMIEQLKQRELSVTTAVARVSWIDLAVAELDLNSVSQETRSFTTEVLKLCASLPVSQPLLADEDDAIEIYFKENNNALLLSINSEGILQVFGDSKKEQWRSKYSLKGRTWKRHLIRFVLELRLNDEPS